MTDICPHCGEHRGVLLAEIDRLQKQVADIPRRLQELVDDHIAARPPGEPRAAEPPSAALATGDEVEWRGHRGKVLAVDVVHVKFKEGHTHFLHAKDLCSPTKLAHADDCECVDCRQRIFELTGHFPGCGVGEGTQKGPCNCKADDAGSRPDETGASNG